MFFHGLINLLKYVTVEPVMFLYFWALALNSLGIQNLLLQKVCFPGPTAPPLGVNECDDELGAQKEIMFIQTWKDLIALVCPVVFVMFAGSWSDNHGKRRKPLIYLPLIGQILSDFTCIINIYFWSWSPEMTALSASVLPAITGWRSCFVIGTLTYLSDLTTVESRTTRMGIAYATYFLATPLGAFIFGLTFNKIGFYGVFLLCVLLNAVAIAYLVLFITESEPDENTVKLKTFEKLIDLKVLIQSFKTILKPRDGYRRAVVLLLLALAPITVSPLQGTWVTTCVLSRLLGVSDTVIGVMSMVTLTVASVGHTFANRIWEIFFYPIVDFMHGAGMAVVYSIISKNVESTELGQANSMIGVADALFPLLNMPLYNQVYNRTFAQMPGAFFLLSVMYGTIGFVLFLVIHILYKKNKLQGDSNKKP